MEQPHWQKTGILLLAVLSSLLVYSLAASSAPDGATVSVISNTTKTSTAGGLANASQFDNGDGGGFIFTINITGNTQNIRWKAYIGNVSGRLTLDDANGATIYDWELSSISGEVYATRTSGTVNWTGIGCATLNVSEHENRILNHSSADDNITATFDVADNQALVVGTRPISASQCLTTNIHINSSGNTEDTFEQVILYDLNDTAVNLTGTTEGNVVYAQNIEQDSLGFDNATTFDFQMIVPERGDSGFTGSTAYYFYLELS